jgi:hypothetical protein
MVCLATVCLLHEILLTVISCFSSSSQRPPASVCAQTTYCVEIRSLLAQQTLPILHAVRRFWFVLVHFSASVTEQNGEILWPRTLGHRISTYSLSVCTALIIPCASIAWKPSRIITLPLIGIGAFQERSFLERSGNPQNLSVYA